MSNNASHHSKLVSRKQSGISLSSRRIEESLARGVDWILSLQDLRGGFPFSFHDKESIGAWPTSQAIAALLSYDPNLIADIPKSIDWLQSTNQDFAWSPMISGSKLLDATVWVALAISIANASVQKNNIDDNQILMQILANSNEDGGWGSWKNERTRVVLTSEILFAIKQIKQSEDLINTDRALKSAVDYLRKAQNSDGGWGFSPLEQSNEVATSYALIALNGADNVQEVTMKGIEWLEAERTVRERPIIRAFKREAVWREDGIQRWSYFTLPLRLYALAIHDHSTKWYKDLRSFLEMQRPDGSWTDPDEPFLAFHTYTAVFFLSKIKALLQTDQFDQYWQVVDEIKLEEKQSILAANRNKLKQIIIEEALSVSDSEFTLNSGMTSKYYYDLKRILMNPSSIPLLGKLIWEIVKNEPLDAIGGPESGAIPMAIAVVRESQEVGQPIRGFFVRKQPKDHGTKKWLEGNVYRGDHVIILEDVVTTGRSIIQAIEKLREYGCDIWGVICIVDRQEGGRERIENLGLRFESLFRHQEFEELL